jgi:hypothetical protein
MGNRKNETKTQRLVMHAILNGLPLKSIDLASKTAIYSAIRKLKKKGWIEKQDHKTFVATKEGYKCSGGVSLKDSFFPQQKRNWIRLHELTFTIKILETPPNWDKEPNSIFFKNAYVNFGLTKYINELIENVSVQIHRQAVVVMVPPITMPTEAEAEKEALSQLERVIRKIEHIYKITLLKENYVNIRVSKASYAHIHNELAEKCIDKQVPLKVFNKDGKVRLIIDFSNKIPELEATHPQLSPSDSRNLTEYWGEWLNNPFMPRDINQLQQDNKELREYLKVLIQSQTIATEQIKTILTLLTPKENIQPQESELKDKPEYIG